MTKTEELELEAIRFACVPELPEPAGPDTPVWIYAIAKVRMTNLSVGYAIVRNEYNGTPHVEKIFGSAAIARIESVHPYKFLDRKYIPTFGSDKEAKAFLEDVYGLEKGELAKRKKDELTALLYNYCAKRQLFDEKNPVRRTVEQNQD